MPSYRTHVSVNLMLGLPLSVAVLKYAMHTNLSDMLTFSAVFIYGTLFLHPDMDLARNIRLFSLKGLLTLPFRPYSYIFKHRGLSHVPIIGTLTRILWLFGCIYLTLFILGKAIPSFEIDQYPLFPYVVIGLATADLFHIILDQIF